MKKFVQVLIFLGVVTFVAGVFYIFFSNGKDIANNVPDTDNPVRYDSPFIPSDLALDSETIRSEAMGNSLTFQMDIPQGAPVQKSANISQRFHDGFIYADVIRVGSIVNSKGFLLDVNLGNTAFDPNKGFYTVEDINGTRFYFQENIYPDIIIDDRGNETVQDFETHNRKYYLPLKNLEADRFHLEIVCTYDENISEVSAKICEDSLKSLKIDGYLKIDKI